MGLVEGGDPTTREWSIEFEDGGEDDGDVVSGLNVTLDFFCVGSGRVFLRGKKACLSFFLMFTGLTWKLLFLERYRNSVPDLASCPVVVVRDFVEEAEPSRALVSTPSAKFLHMAVHIFDHSQQHVPQAW